MPVSRSYGIWFQVSGFALLSVIYLFWTWSRILGDLGGDNAVYLFMAQHYSPWSGHSDVAAVFAQNSQYPPLYPIVLGLFNAGANLLTAHIVTTNFLLAAFAVFCLWMRGLGFSALQASLATFVIAILPGIYFQALSILSENLYLLLSLAGLAAVMRAETDGRVGWLWAAAAAVAAATLTRSAGVSLAAAFLAYLVFNRIAGGWRFALVAVAPMALWSLVNGQLGRGYLSPLVSTYGADFLPVLAEQLRLGVLMLWYGWHSNFTSSAVGTPVLAIVGVISLVGMTYRVYRLKLDGFYALLYLSMLIVWPFPAEAQRFVVVLIPVLLVQGMVLIRDLVRLRIRGHALDLALLVYLPAILLIALPTLAITAVRFLQPLPEPLVEYRRTQSWYLTDPAMALERVVFDSRFVESLQEASNVVPEGGCIYSVKPAIASFYAQRKSAPLPLETTDDLRFHETLKATGCRYFHLAALVTPTFSTPYYPAARLPNRLRIVKALSDHGGNPVAMLAEFADSKFP